MLVLFLVFATSLAANVASLSRQAAGVTTTEGTASNYVPPILVGSNANEAPTSAAPGQWYLIAMLVALACLVAYTYYRQRKRKWDYQPSMIAQILALLIILAFLVVIYEASVLGLGSYLSGGLPGGYFFLYVLIACAAVGLFVAFRRYDLFSPFRRFSGPPVARSPAEQTREEEGNVEELKSIIDRAASSLAGGGDYRAVIIECYRAVVSLLEKNGMAQRPSLTAREFESEVSSMLGVFASGHLHELTRVFERARYSDEPISSSEASRAKEILEQMSSEMTRATLKAAA